MVKKIVLKVIVAIVLTIVIGVLSNSLLPLLGNDIALGQLQNNDAYFVAMNIWYNLQNWLLAVTCIVWLVTIGLVVKDIYKEIKNKEIKNKKETA